MDNRAWWVASVHQDRKETQTRKGPWTVEEDTKLIKYIGLHGKGRWSFLAKAAGLQRTGKSCRLRWVNYLRPDLKRSKITNEEEGLIMELHGRLGNRWSRIAQSLPGRTDNDIKNYWRTRMTKKMNLQVDSGNGNRAMDTDTQVHFESSSMVFNGLTASSKTTSLIDSAEPSSSLPRKNTEDIAVQTNTNPLQEDISPQEIPISERINEYVLRGEIHDPQISDAGQWVATFQEHLEPSDNLFDNSLSYNFSVGSPSVDLPSSEFFTERKLSLSSSYVVPSPQAASDCQSYSYCYWDVLWNMDEEDDRFKFAVSIPGDGIAGDQS